jgi:hypothetical protein
MFPVAKQSLPAKSTTIRTDIHTSVLMLCINGDKAINVTIASHQPKYSYKPLIISDDTQYVTCKNQQLVCAMSLFPKM